MDTAEFLRRIWPATGWYVIARLTGKGFRHQVCEGIEEAAAYALQFDSQGVPTYHACAAFREREVVTKKADGEEWHQVRTHKNVRALRSFYMDLDVEAGNPKKFGSQEEAVGGLVAFCSATGLPIPMVVSSGGGIHIYWTLTDEILPESWKPVAEGLKQLAAKYEFKADPACTSDSSRVLRPIGSWNRKIPASPRAVELVADAAPLGFTDFQRGVLRALHAAGIKPADAVRQVEAPTETINQAFAVSRDFPPCSGEKVATRCQQLAKVRETRGDVAEPLWYAAIQLLCHSTEGDALIHQWSSGYAGYTPQETNRKIAQIRNQGLGPALCATFAARNPGGCDGCPFKGKISSPAQLGTILPSAPAPVVELALTDDATETVTLPPVPAPFTRHEDGGVYVEEDGITHKIYDYDLFPTELAYDEQLGYETMRLRHFLPQDGWKECTLRSSLLASPKDFETALRDQHIQPLIRNKIAMYFDSYIRDIRAKMKLRQLFQSQGWKNDDSEFVLGDKLYRRGEVAQAGISAGAKGFLEHIKPRGSIAPWRELTSIFQTPGFEPHAFMLLTAFAAPLLKIAGRHGFTVCAQGGTGGGKSTMGRFLASVYGHYEATWAKRDDTANARMMRLVAYSALPVYMDEITTIDAEQLRNLVYSIATGKGRDSLKQDRTVRSGGEWETILVASTNDDLQARLQLAKANPEAESMRLFEFKFPKNEQFISVCAPIYDTLEEHYGVAGPLYIAHVVNNLERVKREAKHAIVQVERDFGMASEERFWTQAAALAMYGGRLACEAGVIDFDPATIRSWLLRETQRMRKGVAEQRVGAVAVLAAFLDEHVGERLVVANVNKDFVAQSSPRIYREISQRWEKDTGWLYISQKRIKSYLDKGLHGYQDIAAELTELGVLLDTKTPRTLGAGTDYAGGSVPCWRVKASHPALAGVLEE